MAKEWEEWAAAAPDPAGSAYVMHAAIVNPISRVSPAIRKNVRNAGRQWRADSLLRVGGNKPLAFSKNAAGSERIKRHGSFTDCAVFN